MIRYFICNLEHSSNFSIENVLFQQVEDYDKNIKILRDKERDQLTFYATAPDKNSLKGSWVNPGEKTTCVDDMIILLSLAQSRNIYFPKAEDVSGTETQKWGMPLGGNRKAWGARVILDPEIEDFLIISLGQIRKPKWVDETGFNPAVFWWLESIYQDRPLEIKFVSLFIALEVLANSHSNTNNIKNCGIRSRIEYLADSYSWNFMDRELIKDWTSIRDKYMHTGSTKSLKSLTNTMRAIRFAQLLYSMQIALIDLLGFNNFARRNDMISYIKETDKPLIQDHGPFTIPIN
jgi:hypothetical protein